MASPDVSWCSTAPSPDHPAHRAGHVWVRKHLEHEESLYWCGALVVEPRYLGPIVAGMADDGLVIQVE